MTPAQVSSAAFAAGQALADGAIDPRREAFYRHQQLAVRGDDRFALAARDGAQHLPHGFAGIHHQPGGDRLFGVRMESASIVNAPDVAGDESGSDQSDLYAGTLEFRRDRVGQRAQREFAHGVRRSRRRGAPSGNAAHDGEVTARFLDFGQRGVNRAQHAENIGFELPAVILEREFFQRADNAESGVGDGHVELAPDAHRLGYGALEVAVARDIAGHGERPRRAGRRDFFRQFIEYLDTPRRQSQLRAGARELPRELFTDARRSAGDEHDLIAKKVLDSGHVSLLAVRLSRRARRCIHGDRRSLAALVMTTYEYRAPILRYHCERAGGRGTCFSVSAKKATGGPGAFFNFRSSPSLTAKALLPGSSATDDRSSASSAKIQSSPHFCRSAPARSSGPWGQRPACFC